MSRRRRQLMDRTFTVSAYAGFFVVVAALVVILGPMLWRGATAVLFRGTSEFRRLQMNLHHRGDKIGLNAELERVRKARQPIYDLLDRFSRGIDFKSQIEEARNIYRDYGRAVREAGPAAETQSAQRGLAREIRDALIAAYEAKDKAAAEERLGFVLSHGNDESFQKTPAEGFFSLARTFKQHLETLDLGRRDEYQAALGEVSEALRKLFGPIPGESAPVLAMDQYGATRWDRAALYLDHLLYAEKWAPDAPGMPLKMVRIPRAEQFAGTELAALFPMLEKNIESMLDPRWTFYWQYFIDDSSAGHFFGGVGPEIVGTLVITLLSILFAVPLGVIAAAYLIECTRENWAILVIRTCINTLAGVPSIVFGLFGLAFFVLYLQPRLGLPAGASILAGSLTLAVLVLPVVIRASEEAIRAVPHAYKEAALALGAGRFRTIVTVILPAAMPGILTGVILSMSRAAGETAPILFTAAVAFGPIPRSITQPTRTLSYGAYDLAVGDRIAAMAPHAQYGMVMTLILLVLLLNLAAIIVRARIAKRLRG